jgi:hypothetical protein
MSARNNELRGALELKTSQLRGSSVNNSFHVDVQQSGRVVQKATLDAVGDGEAVAYHTREFRAQTLTTSSAVTFYQLPTPSAECVGIASIRVCGYHVDGDVPVAARFDVGLRNTTGLATGWIMRVLARHVSDGAGTYGTSAVANQGAGNDSLVVDAAFTTFNAQTASTDQEYNDMHFLLTLDTATGALKLTGAGQGSAAMVVYSDVDIMLSPFN